MDNRVNSTIAEIYTESWGYRLYTGIRSIIVYLIVIFLFIIFGPFIILYILVTHDLRYPYRWVRSILWAVFWAAGIRVTVEGLEHVPDPPVMFVANHQSQIEPPAVFMVLPHDVRVFPKKELFRVPIFGHLMRVAKFIPVDRENPEKARRDISRAVDMMHQGVSFLIFPEGTRTRTGRIQRFKKGGFVLAIQAQVPIVPIAISGAFELCRKGEWRIRPGRVLVKILPPISTRGYTFKDREKLVELTRSTIIHALPERYQPLDHPPDR